MKTAGLGVALALAVAVSSATAAAAGGRVEVQVRRTVSCPTRLRSLQISAFASNPSIGAADVSITTGNPNSATGVLGLSSKQRQYGLNSGCHAVSTRIVFSHRGLRSAGASRAGDIRWTTAYCGATRRVLVRFVLALDSSGDPVSATVEVRTQPTRTGKPSSKTIGFVQWTPARSVTYYAPGCTTQDQ